MIRITKEADYGIVLLASMARDAGHSYSAATLAERNRLSLPMVSKILKTLARAGLLVSQRGAQGGYRLARSPREITAAEIIDALEGPIALTECSHTDFNVCAHQDHCSISNHWNRINQAVREALNNISLWELSRPVPVRVDQVQQIRVPADSIEQL